MSELIHARRRDGELRYRLWGTISDGYLTDELDEVTLRAMLTSGERGYVEPPEKLDARLERARRTGSSSLNPYAKPVDLDDPWETARCRRCNGFHHAFVPSHRPDRCRACGEAPTEKWHAPACEPAVPA